MKTKTIKPKTTKLKTTKLKTTKLKTTKLKTKVSRTHKTTKHKTTKPKLKAKNTIVEKEIEEDKKQEIEEEIEEDNKDKKQVKESKKNMNINAMIKQNFESQQPLVLYSKNKETGQETLLEAQKIEKDEMKSLFVKSESKIPPTIVSDNSGKTIMSMSQKKQIIVQSFSNKKNN